MTVVCQRKWVGGWARQTRRQGRGGRLTIWPSTTSRTWSRSCSAIVALLDRRGGGLRSRSSESVVRCRDVSKLVCTVFRCAARLGGWTLPTTSTSREWDGWIKQPIWPVRCSGCSGPPTSKGRPVSRLGSGVVPAPAPYADWNEVPQFIGMYLSTRTCAHTLPASAYDDFIAVDPVSFVADPKVPKGAPNVSSARCPIWPCKDRAPSFSRGPGRVGPQLAATLPVFRNSRAGHGPWAAVVLADDGLVVRYPRPGHC